MLKLYKFAENGYATDVVVPSFKSFPNNEVHLKNFYAVDDDIILITLKYESDEDLFRLMLITKFIQEQGGEPSLFIEYMPYSRMDRSEGGTLFSLKYVAGFINDLKYRKVYVLEPHSDVTTALLDRVVVLSKTVDLVKWASKEDDYDAVLYPDAGAQKRYEALFENSPISTLIGNKTRDFNTGKITGLDINGTIPKKPFACLIVDDLSSYGGTFLKSAELLKQLGATKISLVVTHAENSIFKGDIFSHKSPIDKVFMTSSMLTHHEIEEAYRDTTIKAGDNAHVLKIGGMGYTIADIEIDERGIKRYEESSNE